MLGLAAGCGWSWPFDDRDDPLRCDPGCTVDGERCIDGVCQEPPDCGDGKCEVHESMENCAQDCKACTGDKAECTGVKNEIVGCEKNVWRTFSCDHICQHNKFGFGTGCNVYAANDMCECGGGMGYAGCSPDLPDKPCGVGLLCVRFSETEEGFCSKHCQDDKTCTDAVTTGHKVKCALTMVDKKTTCGFLCTTNNDCPNNMKCGPKYAGFCQVR